VLRSHRCHGLFNCPQTQVSLILALEVKPKLAEWHLITCEYPPKIGGVSDYTFVMAKELTKAGDTVHVWCGPAAGETPQSPGVTVHRDLGGFAPSDLRRAGKRLDEFPVPRRLFVQWVPHGYGYRSMNLFFCVWLWWRARRRRDQVEIMFHEVWLAFGGNWKSNIAAAVHRIMVMFLKHAASRIWISGEAWRKSLRGVRAPIAWLPVPSNVPSNACPTQVAAVREQYKLVGGQLVGHFGIGNTYVESLLRAFVPSLLRERSDVSFLLIGKGGEKFAQEMQQAHPDISQRIFATGLLPPSEISASISACDLLVQPYADGISTRRTAAMAVLANGRALLTTSGHSTEPFWLDCDHWAIVPASDTGALVVRARQILDDKPECERMARAGKRIYDALFDVSLSVQVLRGAREPWNSELVRRLSGAESVTAVSG
jgi:glycosyltransferase involved in cell wall biosynthesis